MRLLFRVVKDAIKVLEPDVLCGFYGRFFCSRCFLNPAATLELGTYPEVLPVCPPFGDNSEVPVRFPEQGVAADSHGASSPAVSVVVDKDAPASIRDASCSR